MIENELHLENEKNPEQAVSDAINSLENKDAADPVLSSYWSRKAKEFFSPSENWKDIKGTAAVTGISLGALLVISGKILFGLFKFAKRAIEKKGDVGFKEGFEIGQEALSFEGKKEKK